MNMIKDLTRKRAVDFDLDAEPVRVGGRWMWPSGFSLPVVSGGAGEGEGDGGAGGDGGDGGGDEGKGGEEKGKGEGGSGDGGKGEGGGEDLAAELEKWKALSKKNEDRAKANAAAQKELDELKRKGMSDQEKAIDEARTEARAAALKEIGSKLVDAEIKAATASKLTDDQRAALLESVDRSVFIRDDGEVDTEKVSAWVEKLGLGKPETGGDEAGKKKDLGQGRRNGEPGKASVAAGRAMFEDRKPASKT